MGHAHVTKPSQLQLPQLHGYSRVHRLSLPSMRPANLQPFHRRDHMGSRPSKAKSLHHPRLPLPRSPHRQRHHASQHTQPRLHPSLPDITASHFCYVFFRATVSYHPRHWCPPWFWPFDHQRHFWLWLWLWLICLLRRTFMLPTRLSIALLDVLHSTRHF